MFNESNRTGLDALSARMRAEWDRRIAHDYRFWMSDGVDSDAQMWETGERDFELLTKGLSREQLSEWVSLEIGCGVGRLVRAAASRFKRAVGIDVSAEGIAAAKRFLDDLPNVELHLGNGLDLDPIADASIDFAYTFAAMSSMPVAVIAGYLSELSRVMRPGAVLRLQMYLGQEQQTFAEDTIAIRSFSKSRFISALQAAGFSPEFTEELKLPFEVSDYESGLIAEIVGMKRTDELPASREAIEMLLLPQGEHQAGSGWDGSETEYLMALSRARQHIDSGRAAEAREAVEFAVRHYARAEHDVLELLEELRNLPAGEVGSGEAQNTTAETTTLVSLPGQSAALGEHFRPDLLQKNLASLAIRFPALSAELLRTHDAEHIGVLSSDEGSAVLTYRGFPLNNRAKPRRAAERWAERALNSPNLETKTTLVVGGFADAFHLEALAEKWQGEIIVFEPSKEVLKAACSIRDLSGILSRIDAIYSSLPELKNALRGLDPDRTELIIHPQTQAVNGEQLSEARRVFQSARGLGKLRPNIGVVGPMYGGSLPIAQYTSQALATIDQRVTPYELQDYYQPFLGLSRYLKDAGRKATVESQFVELLSTMLLEAVTERSIDILICLAQAPLSPRVLTEMRKRGIITVMWFVEDCRRFTTWQQLAPYFDYMFLIQKDENLRMVEQAGAGRAIYLPVGCDPRRHAPLTLTEQEKREYGSQLSFVGAGYNNRRHIFSTLAERDFKIWGTEWPACLPFTKIVQRQGARISVEDYVKVFSASTININLHSSAERDGVEPFGDFVNPRTFELAAAGAFQLTDNRSLLPELFEPGKEVATFSDEKDLHDKIDYYLAHPEERARIAQAGRERALAEHTYEHRLQTMLEYIFADRYEELAGRIERGPWPRTMQAAKAYPELAERFEKVYRRGAEPTLSELIADITQGKGKLTEMEQKLLFLHHIGAQIKQVTKLRQEDDPKN